MPPPENSPAGSTFSRFHTTDWVTAFLADNAAALSLTSSPVFHWLTLAAIGIVIGSVAAILNTVTVFLVDLREGRCSAGFYLSKRLCCWGYGHDECPAWVEWSDNTAASLLVFVLLLVVFSGAAAVIVKRYAPLAAGSGISEIKCIVLGFQLPGFLSLPTLAIKLVGLPLTIALGLLVGKEGPLVHYAACAGSVVAKALGTASPVRYRNYVTLAAAAGVAVAFGSPIGGVLFLLEEILNVFDLSAVWELYLCALVATLTLALVNPFRDHLLVLFHVEYAQLWHVFELPFFLILGLFGGVYGIIVAKLNIRAVAFRKQHLPNGVAEVIFLAAATALICYPFEFLRLDMTESMEVLFHQCSTEYDHWLCGDKSRKEAYRVVLVLLLETVLRMFLVIVSYGCKVPCGIFVPSMAAGATFGRALGLFVQWHQQHSNSGYFSACAAGAASQCITPGTYAFLGAGAALSGITHLTVTVVVIMFELTGALHYILPTMVVVAVTKGVNDRWGHGGIADQMIRFNRLPFIDNKEEPEYKVATSAAMVTRTVVLPETATAGVIKTTLRTGFGEYPVVGPDGMVGVVGREDVLNRLAAVDDATVCGFDGSGRSLQECVNTAPVLVEAASPLEHTHEVFLRLGPRMVVVVEGGRLVGVMTRKDLVAYEYQHLPEGPLSGEAERVVLRVMTRLSEVWGELSARWRR